MRNPSRPVPPPSEPSGTVPPPNDPSGTVPPPSDPSGTVPPPSDPSGTVPPPSDLSGTVPPSSDPSGTVPPSQVPPPQDPAFSGGLRAGSRVAHFEVVELLGQGGMGAVYRARDLQVDREVALKVLAVSAVGGAAAATRFKREADAVASLDHPGILPVYGYGTDPGHRVHWIAMQLVQGQDYRESVLGVGREPIRRAAKVTHAVALALSHAHAQGVIHRDVKPSNVMLAGERIYLVDFGIARLDSAPALTVAPAAMGTPGFMAPEQALEEEATQAADVYALGATLFWALTQELPLRFDSLRGLQLLHAEAAPARSPRALRPEIPRDLEAIVLKALEREPARRYASAAELAQDLGRFLDGAPVAARPPSLARQARHWLRVHRLAAVATLLISVGLIATLGAGRWASGTSAQAAVDALNQELAPLLAEGTPPGELLLGAQRAAEFRAASPEYAALGPAARAPLDAALKELLQRAALSCGRRSENLLRDLVEWERTRSPAPPARLELGRRARELREALQEPCAALPSESVPPGVAAALNLARELDQLLTQGFVTRQVPNLSGMRLSLVTPDDLGGAPLRSGESAQFPAWGAVRSEAARHVPSTRFYGPAQLLKSKGAPRAPTPLRDFHGLYAGMVVVEPLGDPPFLIEAEEVSAGRLADPTRRAGGQGGPPALAASLAQARAFASGAYGSSPRRLPSASEWGWAAGPRPWRVLSRGAPQALRPVDAHDPNDLSPVGCWDMAGNAAEWTAEGFEAGGSSTRGPSLAVRRESRPRQLGFRCARDYPGGGE